MCIIIALILASQPKSAIDDLFGDAEDSEDSDDIFSTKPSSKNIFSPVSDVITPEADKQKNLEEKIQNTNIKASNAPEFSKKIKGLFEDDDDDDDLFSSLPKTVNEMSKTTKSQEPVKKVC